MSRADNNINRVVERAKRYGHAPMYWQAVDQSTGTLTFVDEVDLHLFERENNMGIKWLITPVFDLSKVDYNGYPRGFVVEVSDFDESAGV